MTDTNENVAEERHDEQQAGLDDESAAADPLAQLEADHGRLKDQLLRTAADFDNFRKRTRRDLEDAASRAREELLTELLPVFDNLERAADAAHNATEVTAVAEGVTMVLKQFEDIGSRIGIEKVAALGERFDPQLHDAVQHMESADHDPGTIMAEIMPGYRLRERLVRPAMVVVARLPAPPAPNETPDDEASVEES
ncbi:MAG: nucleotide exchange factor GrpE [Deltaproteobacteria bacterium]|nr:MAG: nucleotide exchange factor GrpE [Deltaproteobacteria bacterium]